MIFTITFVTVICVLIVFKLKAIAHRNTLSPSEEKRLLITGSLFILFFATNVTLPYPQSLYWFVFLSIVLASIVISFKVIKKELRRLKSLNTKDIIINTAFYSLCFIVIHLYI